MVEPGKSVSERSRLHHLLRRVSASFRRVVVEALWPKWISLGAIIGLLYGIVVVMASPVRLNQSEVQLWAVLAVGLTTTAGSVAAHGRQVWSELQETAHVPPRRSLEAAVPLVVLGALLSIFGMIITRQSRLYGLALVLFAILEAGPAGAAMMGIRDAAKAALKTPESMPTQDTGLPPEELIEKLIALRRLLQRPLPGLGALVALATLALGAVRAMQLKNGAKFVIPPAAEIVLGALGTVLLGLAYVPASIALSRCVNWLSSKLFPFSDTPDSSTVDDQQHAQVGVAGSLLKALDNRNRFEQLLSSDEVGVLSDLQARLLIFTPLIGRPAAPPGRVHCRRTSLVGRDVCG